MAKYRKLTKKEQIEFILRHRPNWTIEEFKMWTNKEIKDMSEDIKKELELEGIL